MFNCIIMGAAGRDFHNFRTFFQQHPEFRVCAFTATQIPFIASRVFPRELAGEHYSSDIPIHDESELELLIAEHAVEFVFFAYSDLSHRDVMHKAARVQAAGASFVLLGPGQTCLKSSAAVVAITATRTGAGKSPLTQFLARQLIDAGMRVVTVRHPMPYGNLKAQAVQRFATAEDLDDNECTIEEREEYEPYVRQGLVIYAGVDYAAVLKAAEAEADVVLWDGGNNDFSFFQPDLSIVVCDALRAGHGLDYYPGETNFRSAQLMVINKLAQASAGDVDEIVSLQQRYNPGAEVILSDLEIELDTPEQVAGKRVIVVEDGPTVTHGGMAFGAGLVAAQQYGAAEIIDPRPHALGTIGETFSGNPHLDKVLPAMGYSEVQRRELAETIEASGADVVINGSPAQLEQLLDLSLPVAQVRYRWVQREGPDLLERVRACLS